ncbi:MAG: hypothetical protein IT198_08670 [Acidimicrobiia bacterium]|nr:hypothetical protein [Acidimicrobiia bacterium]
MTARASTLEAGVVAEAAAGAVWMLNHLTLAAPSEGTPGWEDVGDLYRVLGEVGLLIDRLPQVLRQVAENLERSAGSYEADTAAPATAAEMVAGAVLALADAREHLRRAGGSIGAAHSATAHLYMPVPMRVGASAPTAGG